MRYLSCMALTLYALVASAGDYAVLKKPIMQGAHRGGAGLYPENTLHAFQQSAVNFPNVFLEGDVRLTKDGAVVCIHDETVDRTTDGTGTVADLTLPELQALDAAYRFTKDGGRTFPMRGKGVTIPTLGEVLTTLPDKHFLIELKGDPGLADAAIAVFRKHRTLDRVLIASFVPETMQRVRSIAPEVATCYDRVDGMKLLLALRGSSWDDYEPTSAMLSLPHRMVAEYKLTGVDFSAFRAKGIKVQVHTINTPTEMLRWIDMGVDSILSDRPDLLGAVIHERSRTRPRKLLGAE